MARPVKNYILLVDSHKPASLSAGELQGATGSGQRQRKRQ